MARFTHFDAEGKAAMVDISTKDETDDMDRGLDVPSPAWPCQHVTYHGRETCV